MVKILIVEDEIDVRKNISDILEFNGYDVLEADNGESALDIIKNNFPDMIVSDYMMPKMDGLEFLKEFRKQYSKINVPFLFLSAKVDYNSIRECMDLGADDYLIKPFRVNELLNAVKSRIDRSKAIEQSMITANHHFIPPVQTELRNLLVPLLGYSEVMMNDFNDFSEDELIEMISTIHRSCRSLKNSVERFVNLSEVENIKTDDSYFKKFKQQKIVLSQEILKEKIEEKFTENDFAGRTIQLSIEKCEVSISENCLSTIVMELLDNALKYSKSQSKIEINGQTAGDTYQLVFINEGSGFPQSKIKEFESFSHFERRQSLPERGLGLFLTKKILEIFESKLEIENLLDGKISIRIELKKKTN